MEETNLYSISIPPMLKALEALKGVLEKGKKHADSKKLSWADFEPALLADRIIFDQFPLVKQIQVACDNAKGGAARLAEVEIPKFEDTEATIEELKLRIDKTIAFVKTIKPEQIIGKEQVKVSLPFWDGKHMTGFDYVTQYLMPNFYFHVTTAYTILRKNGVDVGKSDFAGGLPLKG
jgi:hypothetical protein